MISTAIQGLGSRLGGRAWLWTGLLLFMAVRLHGAVVGHWKFDDGGGSLATDAGGRFPGVLTSSGARFVSDGVSGGALQLNRTEGGFVRLPPMLNLVAGDFSVVFWARLAAGDTTEETFALSLHEAWSSNGFFILLNQSGGFGAPGKASFVVTEVTQTGIAPTLINDGQWHQIALVYRKSGETSFYVDGPVAEVSLPSIGIIDRQPPLLVGASYGREVVHGPKPEFTGWIDDLQIYDQALTDLDLGKLFRNPGRTIAELTVPLELSPSTGTFVDTLEVSVISTVAGAAIRYTMDGTEPGPESTVYHTPIVVRQTSTLKARLFVGGFAVSEIVTGTYVKAAPVAFHPAAGRFTNSVSVVLRNHLNLGVLTYTLDGTEPTAGSSRYTDPLVINETKTVRARVFVNGFPASEVYVAEYLRVYAVEDGISNDWREKYFGPGYATDARVAAEADPDGDGWSNRLEFDQGTNPLDAQSQPAVVATIRSVPRISWNSVPGQVYRVWRKAGAEATVWEIVLQDFRATAATSRYVDADAPAAALYRIELVR